MLLYLLLEMIMKSLPLLKKVIGVTTLLLANATVATANGEVAQPETEETPAQIEETPQPVSQTIIADGQPIQLHEVGLSITPPTEWVVRSFAAGMSLVMHEKDVELKEKEIDYSKPLFKRNITVTSRPFATPIDEKTAEELKEGLTKSMEESPLAADFKVLEHKFFNYKGENDGLVLYSQLTLGSFPMMQMHVLLSGADRQYLLSYTDLADEFQNNQEAFQAAWTTMTTVEFEGQAPVRYKELAIKGGAGFGILLLIITLFSLKRRSNRKKIEQYADSIYEDDGASLGDDPITQSGVWILDDAVSQKEARSGFSSVSNF